jgi:hypothetical protein
MYFARAVANMPQSPVGSAFWRTMQFHLGTIAFGSLMLVVFICYYLLLGITVIKFNKRTSPLRIILFFFQFRSSWAQRNSSGFTSCAFFIVNVFRVFLL